VARNRFLRPDVAAEPLYNQWYAWWYLLAPATAPLFVQNLHVKLMRSFLDAPEMHAMALRNPALRGGPYLDIAVEHAPAVRRLLERTLADQAGALRFAEAVTELDRLLAAVPAGMSLESSYAQVPALLRGYVELVYDLHHRPSARFLESLLYRGEHHRTASQSIALRALAGDARPYVFSTPRLADDATLELRVAFHDPALDRLFAARDVAAPVDALREALGVPGARAAQFDGLFTDEAPAPRPRFDGDGVRCRYFGHACVLLETRDVSVLIDPAIPYRHAGAPLRFSFADLPDRIDHVVVTHGHADHLMLESLLPLRHRIGSIIVPRSGGALEDPSLKLMLRHAGFPRVVELDELETLALPGGEITGVPFFGEHGDLGVRAKLAHRIELAGRSFLMAADSNAIEPRLYDHVHAALGGVDVVFLGMESEGAPMSWMYGPLLRAPLSRKADHSRRLNGSNCARARAIIERLRPEAVYVYAMGREPWLGHVMALGYQDDAPQLVEARALLAACRAQGIEADLPFIRAEYRFARR
jgi:L-ascorbate metabolism protein UlaG (beta-lactamase superfamily)